MVHRFSKRKVETIWGDVKMFISKKKYQEKMDLLDGYKDKVYRRNDKIADLEKEKDMLNNNIKSLEKSNIKLIEENQKLIDWIQKILEEFGTCDVDVERVQIPIHKTSVICSTLDNSYIGEKTRIEIPAITIIKMGRCDGETIKK